MKTILLIEDDAFIRESTAELLTLTGYAVHTAENGKIGVETALATRPDLVICDITMPVLDGYGVLHIFNQNPQLAGVPFISSPPKRSAPTSAGAWSWEPTITSPSPSARTSC